MVAFRSLLFGGEIALSVNLCLHDNNRFKMWVICKGIQRFCGNAGSISLCLKPVTKQTQPIIYPVNITNLCLHFPIMLGIWPVQVFESLHLLSSVHQLQYLELHFSSLTLLNLQEITHIFEDFLDACGEARVLSMIFRDLSPALPYESEYESESEYEYESESV